MAVMEILEGPTYETPEGYEELIAVHEAELAWAEITRLDQAGRRTKIVEDLPPCEL